MNAKAVRLGTADMLHKVVVTLDERHHPQQSDTFGLFVQARWFDAHRPLEQFDPSLGREFCASARQHIERIRL